MDPEFWRERWRNNEIGFHQNETNPHLRAFWPNVGAKPGSRVFVPLCGKSLDMRWLAEQGFEVLGVEISPLAVEAFFAENGLAAERGQEEHFERWRSGPVEVRCGDFFDLAPGHVTTCSSVFDRASLVALPPSLRGPYVAHMTRLFPQPIPTLLVTMEYPADEMAGPPFCVTEQEVEALYGARFHIERQVMRDVLAEYPHLRERGLSRLQEKVYILRPAQP